RRLVRAGRRRPGDGLAGAALLAPAQLAEAVQHAAREQRRLVGGEGYAIAGDDDIHFAGHGVGQNAYYLSRNPRHGSTTNWVVPMHPPIMVNKSLTPAAR